MTQTIHNQIEKMNLIELCEQYNLKEFEQDRFLKIRQLGKGAFGEVWMCYDLLEDERVAVKFVKVKEIEDEDKRIENISSFMREKEILETISLKAVDSISKFFGAYYSIDGEGQIESLILVSESGDYNLDQLVKARKDRAEINLPPYNSYEVLGFLTQISEGYQALQELKIYHSDTKPANIVFSKSKNKFIIIDFGVSKLVQSTNLGKTKVCDYGGAGTKDFFSPEKEQYWQWAAKNAEESSDAYPELFIPYKCDMWSLGICLEKMIGIENSFDSKKNEGNKVLSYIINRLKEKDWNKRFDAQELSKYISEHKLRDYTKKSGMLNKEAKLIRSLNEEKYEKRKQRIKIEKEKQKGIGN